MVLVDCYKEAKEKSALTCEIKADDSICNVVKLSPALS